MRSGISPSAKPSTFWPHVRKLLKRPALLLLMALSAAGTARAESVLNRIGGASDFTGDLISDTTNFSIQWEAGFAGSFEKVKLRVYNVSGVSAITSLSLAFSLDDGAGVSVEGVNTYNNGAVDDISDYEFDLGDLHLIFDLGESGALYFHKDAAGSSGGIVNWSTTDREVDAYFGWSGGETLGLSGNGQYDLSAVAVPEPAVCGLLGVGLLGLALRLRAKRS